MLHEPAAQSGPDSSAPFKARLGVYMFIFYLFFYAGFVTLNLWKPLWMEARVLLGMNLATVYGFALIVGALVQAMIYSFFCSARERAMSDQAEEGKDPQ